MDVMRRGWRQAIVSVVLIGAALPARAETRTTSLATYLHVGPGRQYAVSDELQARETVDVAGCQNDWCEVRYGGGSGWIEQRMLAAAAAQPAGAGPAECFAYTSTGWPNSGDHERICIQKPAPK